MGGGRHSIGPKIAYFVTPHGFGHAARTAAVMAALQAFQPGIRFELFTRVPAWFFAQSLGSAFGYHSLLTDIGLAQETALREDAPETLRRLSEFLPFDAVLVRRLAGEIVGLGCQLLVCDIAPLGIAVAREAGIPSVLVENFTWNWIYEGYVPESGAAEGDRWQDFINYLAAEFDAADHRIQTEPVSVRVAADLTTAPVSREPKLDRDQVRRDLGIPEGSRTVMITTGGIPWRYTFLDRLADMAGSCTFLLPMVGEGGTHIQRKQPSNLVFLPSESGFFHPDLVNACDVVIGKAGYSTVAELYWSGVPFGYVAREKFRESESLVAFVESYMSGIAFSEKQFVDGSWVTDLPNLLDLPRNKPQGQNGADEAANYIIELLSQR